MVDKVGCTLPFLYLSNYISRDKSDYLQAIDKTEYLMLFEEDVESDDVGLIILKNK